MLRGHSFAVRRGRVGRYRFCDSGDLAETEGSSVVRELRKGHPDRCITMSRRFCITGCQTGMKLKGGDLISPSSRWLNAGKASCEEHGRMVDGLLTKSMALSVGRQVGEYGAVTERGLKC